MRNRNAESVGYVRKSLRKLLKNSRVARLKLESQGCRNPGLELANAFSVLPGNPEFLNRKTAADPAPVAHELVKAVSFPRKQLFFPGSEAILAEYQDISSGEVTDPGW